MALTIEQLEIDVQAKAQSANQALDDFSAKLLNLSGSLASIEGHTGASRNIRDMSNSLRNLSRACASISQANVSKTVSEVGKLATTLSSVGGIDKSVTNFTNSLSRLTSATSKMTVGSSVNMLNFGKSLREVFTIMSTAPQVSQQTTSFTQSLGRIMQFGTNIPSVANNFGALGHGLQSLITQLNSMPTIRGDVLTLVGALGNLANSNLSLNSAFSMASTGSNNFRKSIDTLKLAFSKLGDITKKVLLTIASFTKTLGSGVLRITGFSKAFSGLRDRINGSNRSAKGFVSTIGLFYAKFFLVIRLFKAFGAGIKRSMDYIEEFNYFNVTLQKIASEWKSDYAKWGYNSADAYSDSFEDRLKSRMGKMSGYSMLDDGTLLFNAEKNLGLDVTALTNYSAGLASLTNSLNMTGEASAVVSEAITMLAGDVSSFRNIPLTDAMNKFRSGLIGQSRALYALGIDITQASLAEEAYRLGIDKAVSSMTQAEKLQLRFLIILRQSRAAWGDLANTIQSPSNQLRMLQTQFTNISRTIGGMFLVVVSKGLPYINALAIAFQKLLQNITSFLGIDLSGIISDSGVGYDDTFEDVADDIEATSDKATEATKNVKKLNKSLMSFDDLNVISTTTTGDKKAQGDTSTDAGTIDLTSQMEKALKDYRKVWNKAFKNMQADAQKLADKITNAFESAWASQDGSFIGEAIARWFNNGLKNVNAKLPTFKKFLDKSVNILASMMNGAIDNFDFSLLGDTVGKAIKIIFDAKSDWFEKVKWFKLGKGLGKSLNAFVKTGAITSVLNSVASTLKAKIETALGLAFEIDYEALGAEFANGINTVFNSFNSADSSTELTTWQSAGVTLSLAVKGIITTLSTTIKNIKWKDLRNGIVQGINSFDFEGVGFNFGNLVTSVANGIGDLIGEPESWSNLGSHLTDGINGFFKTADMKKVGESAGGLIRGILSFVTGAVENVNWDKVGQSIADFIEGIKFGKIIKDLGKLAKAIFKALANTFRGSFSSHPVMTVFATSLIGVICGIKFAVTALLPLATKILVNIAGNFAVSGGVARLGTKLAAVLTGSSVMTKISAAGVVIGQALAVALTAIVGTDVGMFFGNKLIDICGTEVQKANKYNLKWKDLFEYSPAEWGKGIRDWLKDVFDGGYHLNKDGGGGGTSFEVNEAKQTEEKLKVKVDDEEAQAKIKNLVANATKNVTVNADTKEAMRRAEEVTKDGTKNVKAKFSMSGDDKKVYNYLTGKTSTKKELELAVRAKYTVTNGKTSSNTSIPYGDLLQIAKITSKATGGIQKGGVWQNVAKYANGGYPDTSQLFIARESGPELVGQIGGSTAVVNNDQIVSSVANGVRNAIMPLMESVIIAINSANSGSDGEYTAYVNDDVLFKVVKDKNKQYRMRTGYSAI